MNKTCEQAIFDVVFDICKGSGVGVYDYLPDLDVDYPFIDVGDVSVDFWSTKSHLRADVSLEVSVWGLRYDRKKVSDLASFILRECFKLDSAYGYSCRLLASSSGVKLVDDNSTVTPLKRAILQLNFRIL